MTLSRFVPEPWMEAALCSQTDPELFFPELGASTRDAKAICAQCPVLAHCRAYALEHRERGVWGGTSDQDRARLRARAKAA